MLCFSNHKLLQMLKGCVLISLILAVFLLTNFAQAAETSEFVPAPEITSFKDGQVLTGEVVVKGVALNYSQVKVFLDNNFIGYSKNKIGTLGWQDFEIKLPANLVFGQHNLELVTEYFNNTQSPTTTLSFYYQPQFPAPTLFKPVLNYETNYQQPWIVGLAWGNYTLEVYIDDQLDGKVFFTNPKGGVSDFKYQPQKKLTPGFHVVRARAISSDGRISNFSNEIIFEVRQTKQILEAPDLPQEMGDFVPPVPAPTLVKPKNGLVTQDNKLIVAGLVHNEHYVKIYLDGKLVGEFMPDPHPSGVTNFAWEYSQPLSSGLHKIWAKDVNPRGNESGRSNVLRFIVLPSEPIFVSQSLGQIAAAAKNQKALESGEQSPPAVDGQGQSASNKPDETKQFKWWQILIIIVLALAVLLIVFWLVNLKKGKSFNQVQDKEEKVKIKTNGKKEKGAFQSLDKTQDRSDLAEEQQVREKKEELENKQGSYKPDVPDQVSDSESGLGADKENNKNEEGERGEHVPPPPPPPDAPTLGI